MATLHDDGWLERDARNLAAAAPDAAATEKWAERARRRHERYSGKSRRARHADERVQPSGGAREGKEAERRSSRARYARRKEAFERRFSFRKTVVARAKTRRLVLARSPHSSFRRGAPAEARGRCSSRPRARAPFHVSTSAICEAPDVVQPPVVQVVPQVPVADAELEILQEARVLHQVQRVEHVKVLGPGKDQRVLHELLDVRLRGHVVVRVRRAQRVVPAVTLDHRRRQRVERHEVGDRARLVGILHDVRVHHPLAHGEVVLHPAR